MLAFAYADDPLTLPHLISTSKNGTHADFLREVRKCVKRSKEQFVKHFKTKYTAHNDLPIWMATELMTIGTVTRMYQGASNRERHPVANHYGVSISEFESWLVMLTDLRNVCAHHARLWNRALAKQPSVPPTWMTPVPISSTTVFAALTVCAYAISKISIDVRWQKRVRKLIDAFPAIPKDRTSNGWTMGMPANWLDCPIWTCAK